MVMVESCLIGNETKEKELWGVSPFLLVIRGIPGSGKSFLANALKTDLLETTTPIEILDPDAIKKDSDHYREFCDRLKNEEPTLDPKIYPYRYLLSLAQKALQAQGLVIWSQAFIDLNNLNYTIKKLKGSMLESKVGVLIIEVLTPVEIAKERVVRRIEGGGRGPNETIFYKFVENFRSSATLGYDIMVVDGSSMASQTVPLILDKLPKTHG